MGNAVNHTAQIDGRTQARRDTNPRQIRCLFTAVLSARATPRQRAPALTITSPRCQMSRAEREPWLGQQGDVMAPDYSGHSRPLV